MSNREVAGCIAVLKGSNPGKNLVIMAGVHGNEICGIRALEELVPQLVITSGIVTFLLGNIEAIRTGTRQVEQNLNRMFRPDVDINSEEKSSYEYRRSRELMPILSQADALLDIHSSRSKEASPFAICEPHSFFIAEKLPVPIVSYGWDKLEPGGTDYFVNKCGGYGICVECGYHIDPASVERAKQSVMTFLALMGATRDLTYVISQQKKQRRIRVYGIYHTIRNFRPARNFVDFGPVQQGELIGVDGDEEVRAEDNCLVIFVEQCDGSGEEAFLIAQEE